MVDVILPSPRDSRGRIGVQCPKIVVQIDRQMAFEKQSLERVRTELRQLKNERPQSFIDAAVDLLGGADLAAAEQSIDKAEQALIEAEKSNHTSLLSKIRPKKSINVNGLQDAVIEARLARSTIVSGIRRSAEFAGTMKGIEEEYNRRIKHASTEISTRSASMQQLSALKLALTQLINQSAIIGLWMPIKPPKQTDALCDAINVAMQEVISGDVSPPFTEKDDRPDNQNEQAKAHAIVTRDIISALVQTREEPEQEVSDDDLMEMTKAFSLPGEDATALDTVRDDGGAVMEDGAALQMAMTTAQAEAEEDILAPMEALVSDISATPPAETPLKEFLGGKTTSDLPKRNDVAPQSEKGAPSPATGVVSSSSATREPFVMWRSVNRWPGADRLPQSLFSPRQRDFNDWPRAYPGQVKPFIAHSYFIPLRPTPVPHANGPTNLKILLANGFMNDLWRIKGGEYCTICGQKGDNMDLQPAWNIYYPKTAQHVGVLELAGVWPLCELCRDVFHLAEKMDGAKRSAATGRLCRINGWTMEETQAWLAYAKDEREACREIGWALDMHCLDEHGLSPLVVTSTWRLGKQGQIVKRIGDDTLRTFIIGAAISIDGATIPALPLQAFYVDCV